MPTQGGLLWLPRILGTEAGAPFPLNFILSFKNKIWGKKSLKQLDRPLTALNSSF
jgi:hypothetical protein